jgi:hypothetical protein
MGRKRSAILLGFACAVLAAGCAEPPTARVDAAKAQVAALAAEAQTYAPDAYRTAQAAVSQLDAEMVTQEGTFALTRSYDAAGELAGAVEAAAGDLAQAIEQGKQRAQSAASQAIADARSAAADARQSFESLLADDETPEEQQMAFQADLDGVDAALGEAIADARSAAADARQSFESLLADDETPEEQQMAFQADLDGVDAALGEADTLLAGDQWEAAEQEAESARQAAMGVGTAVAEVQTALAEAREAAADRAARGEITIPRGVMVQGSRLAAGSYMLRLADEDSEASGRWVEFVGADDTVAGRALAVVIPDADIGEVAKTPGPRNETRVAELRGGEYVRVWLNRGGVNYLLHLVTG